MKQDVASAFWKENVSLIIKLVIVWFLVSFGFGIILREPLDAITIGGFGLGFWFAQQGSIYCFIILIFVYAMLMNKIEKKYGVNE